MQVVGIKKKLKNKEDISIGENIWIEWIDFDYKNSNTIEIDEFLQPTMNFWAGLEIHCVAGCCGIDAFSFWREDIKNSSNQFDQNYLIKELNLLKEKISNLHNDELMSSRINNLFHKKVFLQLIEHILQQIKS